MPNFGAVEIDWDATPVTLKIQVRDTDGNPVAGVTTPLSELQARNFSYSTSNKVGKHQRHCLLEVDQPWIVRYRLAILASCALASMFVSDFQLSVKCILYSCMNAPVSNLLILIFSIHCYSIGSCHARHDLACYIMLQEMSPQEQARLTD